VTEILSAEITMTVFFHTDDYELAKSQSPSGRNVWTFKIVIRWGLFRKKTLFYKTPVEIDYSEATSKASEWASSHAKSLGNKPLIFIGVRP